MTRAWLLKARRYLFNPWPRLVRKTFTARDLAQLQRAMGWSVTPTLEGEHLHAYHNELDLNQRPLRDAEVIGAACANHNSGILLEIGTSMGHMTAIMARNAPQATVHTVNIPPEEIDAGGKHVTYAPTREQIGSYYRSLSLSNIRQIFANTARWEPDFGPIQVAFIDGCHDADFVFNDTRKVLKRCQPGSILLWHDFNPSLRETLPWHAEVASGVEKLFAKRYLRGNIIHMQDSWVGLYKVGEKDRFGSRA